MIILMAALIACSCDMEYQLGNISKEEDPAAAAGLRNILFGLVNENGDIVPWRDSVTMVQALEKLEQIFGDSSVSGITKDNLYETVEYNKSTGKLKLRLIPEDAEISSVSVSSSDTTLLRITKEKSFLDYKMETFGVGDVTVKLKIGVNDAIITKTYNIRIKEMMTFVVYVDEFWNFPERNKIRYYCTNLPPNVDKMALTIKDSLLVEAQCEWKDEQKGINSFRTEYKTFSFKKESKDRAFKKNKRCIIKDFSEVSETFITGGEYEDTTFVEKQYHYRPLQAKYYIDIVTDSPYYGFNVYVRINDNATDDDYQPHTYDDITKSDTTAVKYCPVSFCSNLTPEEEQKIRDELNEKLKGLETGNADDEWTVEMFEGMSSEEIEEFLKGLKKKK